ncbi:thiamine pyrophosphate-binding protein [Aspergillus undulatus]|uniref:thiamine pyrophosphate-binding protein n=1 Tax=Aspergillus undulatus TaxID=1810928 RepID=UPI003CCE2FA1
MPFPLTHPTTRALTGGDLLAQSLAHLGVKDAFGLHGGHLDAFLMGCENSGIKLIDTRHETAAVQAAESYAKIRQTIGVAFVTANSGFSNGIPGLATAHADRSPILVITSSPPLRDAENNSLQGIIDQVVVARPLTKFAMRVTCPEDAPRLVSLAARSALAGTPGPVLLDFPIDVLFTPVHERLISWGSISSPLSYAPGPHVEAVKEAVALLKNASRPAVIIGSGGQSIEATKALLTFSNTNHIPIFDTNKCTLSSTLPKECHYYGGGADRLALLPHIKTDQPDLILLLGARTGMFLGGRSGAIIPPQKECKLIHVDIDGGEIGRTVPVDLGVISDVGQFVTAVNSQLALQSASSEETGLNIDNDWVTALASLTALPSPYENDTKIGPSGRMHPYHALKEFMTSIPKDAILILDGGECAIWAAGLAHLSSPSAIFKSTGALGFLGNGFGYALGAAIAAPDKKVINLQGDGSAGFHFMELDTYARLDLDVLTVVVNNFCWGMSSNGQELVYGDANPKRPVSKLSPLTRYGDVSRGLGNAGIKITKVEDVKKEVRKIVDGTRTVPGPACVELVVDSKPIHPVTEAMVGRTEDENLVVVPYYDNIPRAYYKDS